MKILRIFLIVLVVISSRTHASQNSDNGILSQLSTGKIQLDFNFKCKVSTSEIAFDNNLVENPCLKKIKSSLPSKKQTKLLTPNSKIHKYIYGD